MIEVRNLYVDRGKKNIITSFNLSISNGDFVVITGKSGTGKTTLLKAIAMLIKSEKGEVLYNDVDILQLSNKKQNDFIRKDLGFVFQDYMLLEDKSVYDNLSFCIPSKQNKKEVLIEKFKLFDLDETIIDQKVMTLSGGEKQRIALLRALLKEPKIILADEPTGNLDNENATKVMNSLKRMNEQGIIVVMVTHDLSLLSYSTKHVELLRS